MHYFLRVSYFLLACLLLNACGGSNGGSSSNDLSDQGASENREDAIVIDESKMEVDELLTTTAEEFQIPAQLFQALAFYQSGWQAPEDGDEHTHSDPDRHGIFGLSSAQVTQASQLTSNSFAEIELDDEANIRAAAALLSLIARTELGDDFSESASLGDFFSVIAKFSDSQDQMIEQYFAEEVFRILENGAEQKNTDGSVLKLEGVHTEARKSNIVSSNYTAYKSALDVAPQKVGDSIADDLILAHSSNYSDGRSSSVQRIVLHTIEGSATGAISWFRNPSANVSAHYIVAKSGRITQMVYEHDTAWHVGGNNSDTIGLEHEGYASRGDFTEDELLASFRLICDIAQRYNIPVDRQHIVSHAELDPARRTDPGPHWPWDRMFSEVSQCVNGTSEKPDLSIDNISWTPENPQPGDEVTFHSQISNNASSGTMNNVGVAYYVNGDYVGFGARTSMNGYETSTDLDMRSSWTLPDYGTFEISAFVDDTRIVDESDEENNTLAQQLSVNDPNARADLIIESLWWEPTQPEIDDTVTFHARVVNQGNAETINNVGLAYFINGEQIGWGARAPMSAGASSDDFSMRQTWTIENSGTFTISAMVDDLNTIEELDESNNILESSLTVLDPIVLPDLTITRFWWAPENPEPGDEVQFHSEVLNNSTGATEANVGVAYFVNGEQVGWGARIAMTPMESSTDFDMAQYWIMPDYGTYDFSAHVNDTGRVEESDTSNNQRTETYSASPPDLADMVITDFWWTPEQPEVGDEVTFHAIVSNQGTAMTPANVGVGYFVNGAQVGWGARTQMDAGETSSDVSMRQTWTVTDAGDFEVSAFVDDIDRFPELDETNNRNTTTLSVTPPIADTVVDALWWTPENPRAGDEVTFYATVTNIGAQATEGNVGLAYFVDGEYIGWGARSAMNAGESSSEFTMRSSPWVVPSNGNFNVSAFVNDNSIFEEYSRENNSLQTILVVD